MAQTKELPNTGNSSGTSIEVGGIMGKHEKGEANSQLGPETGHSQQTVEEYIRHAMRCRHPEWDEDTLEARLAGMMHPILKKHYQELMEFDEQMRQEDPTYTTTYDVWREVHDSHDV